MLSPDAFLPSLRGDVLKQKELKLDGRLSLCSELVRSGANIADIGTDHAYLPVFLARSGRINHAIAADINQKPLEYGAKTVKEYGLSDKIEIRLSDGLDAVSPNECDDIVIAGMGGELICSIIDRAGWLRDPLKHLILQPMTRPETLRSYLYENGFEITDERAAESAGRIYTVMLAVYSGNAKRITAAESYIGKLQPNMRRLDRLYIDTAVASLVKKRDGLLSGGDRGGFNYVANIIDEIKRLTGDEND